MSQTTSSGQTTSEGIAPAEQALTRSRIWARLSDVSLLALLALLVVIFSISSPFFLSTSNFLIVASNIAVILLLALPQTFLLVSANADLSQGGVVAMTAVLIGVVTEAGANVWVGVLVAVAAGLAVGLINGLTVVYGRINSIIVTLGTLSATTGLAFMLTNAKTKIIPDENGFGFLGAGDIGPFPTQVVIATLFFVGFLLVERTTIFGRHIYALGGNLEAARRSGIRVTGITMWLFALCGLFAGLGGVIVTSQLRAAAPQVGTTLFLLVVTAVILGGTSLTGGRGTVVGTLIAALVLGVLRNGFALLQFSSDAEDVVLGIVLIVAVLVDTRLGQRLRGGAAQ